MGQRRRHPETTKEIVTYVQILHNLHWTSVDENKSSLYIICKDALISGVICPVIGSERKTHLSINNHCRCLTTVIFLSHTSQIS